MADPNKNTPDDVIGGIDPNAFDAQMLLMDIFLGNVPDLKLYRTGNDPAVEDPYQNVPYLATGFDSVNALTGVLRDGTLGAINNFISNLDFNPIRPSRYFFLSTLPKKNQVDLDDDLFANRKFIKNFVNKVNKKNFK